MRFERFQRFSRFGRCFGGRLGEPLRGYLGWLLEGRSREKGGGRGGILKAFSAVFSRFQPFSIVVIRFQPFSEPFSEYDRTRTAVFRV